MIQTVVEDKYSFSMQVSAEAMAALDPDHSRWNAHLVRRRLTSRFNQLAIAPPARLGPPIGLRYGHIINPYLRGARLSTSCALAAGASTAYA
jgi:hypothetical protein